MQETQSAFIQQLIQNPHEPGRQHIPELERLSQAYPASNFVHILLAKSRQNQPGFDDSLNKAAIYSADRKALFYFIHQPEKLLGAGEVEVVREVGVVEEVGEEDKSEISNPKSGIEEQSPQADFTEENVENILEEGKSEIVNPKSEITNEIEDEVFEEIAETPFAFINQENRSDIDDGESPQVAAENGRIEDEIFEEISEASFIPIKTDINVSAVDGESPQMAAETGNIDDEIFEEINEASFIDIKTDSAAQAADGESSQTAADTGAINEETFEEITEAPITKSGSNKSEIVNPKSQIPSLESFHIDSVIPSLEELPLPEDKSGIENPKSEVEEIESVVEEGQFEVVNPKFETSSQTQPSRYHDEKMPYSFMWWLDKTRQEHAQTYQPYASPFRPDTSAQIETAVAAKEPLEQQYIEHIFHLRSVEELEQSTTQPQTVPFAVDKKETKIIEKFIREEPQISTPRPEKLDVENKARKSTEDKLDMVSETLAKIYTEQMLYHKAIDTYQKLRLKYPDKSGYFAARIDELEQKIR